MGYEDFTSIEYMDNIEMTPMGWAKDKILTGEIGKYWIPQMVRITFIQFPYRDMAIIRQIIRRALCRKLR